MLVHVEQLLKDKHPFADRLEIEKKRNKPTENP